MPVGGTEQHACGSDFPAGTTGGHLGLHSPGSLDVPEQDIRAGKASRSRVPQSRKAPQTEQPQTMQSDFSCMLHSAHLVLSVGENGKTVSIEVYPVGAMKCK